MEFLNAYYLTAVVIVVLFFVFKPKSLPFSKDIAQKLVIKGKISKKFKFYLLILAYIFFVIALARPVINNGYTIIKAPLQNIVIGLDISEGMQAKDLYPNREKFAVNKIEDLLKNLNHQNVALILFDKRSYLISPPTNDYASLIYLLKHTNLKDVARSESPDIYNMLKSAVSLVKNPKIALFTWGGNTDIQKAESFIKNNKIKTYIYICGKNDKNYPPNPALKTLGKVFYPEYSNQNIKKLAKLLNSSKEKDIKVKDKTELFYYPLGAGIIILFFIIFYPFRRNR